MTKKLVWLVVAAIMVALIIPAGASAKTFKIGVTQIVSSRPGCGSEGF